MASEEQGAVATPDGGLLVSEALRNLKAGVITLDEYLDHCAEAGLADVKRLGLVTGEQLEFLRQMLREQLTTEPRFIELVRRVTGIVNPQPRDP